MTLGRTAMSRLRLRTQLFLATLLTICALTGAFLLIIRHTVIVETDRQVRAGTEDSIRAFEGVQHQRERQLSSSAAMIADLPPLKSLNSSRATSPPSLPPAMCRRSAHRSRTAPSAPGVTLGSTPANRSAT